MKIIIYSILILHLLDDKRMVKYDIIPDLIIVSNSLIVGKMVMVTILDMVASSDRLNLARFLRQNFNMGAQACQ